MINLSHTDDRLETFQSNADIKSADAKKLASSGFFLTSEGNIECFACGARHKDPPIGADADKIHLRLSPSCPYVKSDQRKLEKEDQSIVQYAEYITYSARRRKFEKGWDDSQGPPRDQLASAGFLPLTPKHTMCYHCGIVLTDWSVGDNPWSVHARSFPTCRHVVLMKGGDYVKHAVQSRGVTESRPVSLKVDVCKSCFGGRMSCCLFPCGHVTVCSGCASTTRSCPVCSTEVLSTRRIYYA